MLNFVFFSGEKLSKQQLHNSNTIKKLRAKEKERENINSKQNKKIKELEEELQHLKQVRFAFFSQKLFSSAFWGSCRWTYFLVVFC